MPVKPWIKVQRCHQCQISPLVCPSRLWTIVMYFIILESILSNIRCIILLLRYQIRNSPTHLDSVQQLYSLKKFPCFGVGWVDGRVFTNKNRLPLPPPSSPSGHSSTGRVLSSQAVLFCPHNWRQKQKSNKILVCQQKFPPPPLFWLFLRWVIGVGQM